MNKWLSKVNPTLVELIAGCLIYAALGEVIILIILPLFYKDSILSIAVGFLFGVAIMILMAIHMYLSLNTAMDLGEANAVKYMMKRFVYRMVAVLIIFFVIYFTHIINVIAMVCGMVSLKVAAYLQPITHKFITKKFNKGR